MKQKQKHVFKSTIWCWTPYLKNPQKSSQKSTGGKMFERQANATCHQATPASFATGGLGRWRFGGWQQNGGKCLGEDDRKWPSCYYIYINIHQIYNLCKIYIYVMYTVLHVYLVCLLNFLSGTVWNQWGATMSRFQSIRTGPIKAALREASFTTPRWVATVVLLMLNLMWLFVIWFFLNEFFDMSHEYRVSKTQRLIFWGLRSWSADVTSHFVLTSGHIGDFLAASELVAPESLVPCLLCHKM